MPAVSFGTEVLDVTDLVVLGLHLGTWSRFEAHVRRGRALSALSLDPIGPAEIKAGATRFRYGANLVSALDFTTWLRARGLKVADLSDVIERRLLREREAGRQTEGPDPDIAAVLWAEATCQGVLHTLANLAADRLAARSRVGPGELTPPDAERVDDLTARAQGLEAAGLSRLSEADLAGRVSRMLARDAALEHFREQVADDQALARCMATHVLEWLQVHGTELSVATEGAAREVRMLLTDDGLALDQAAERAHAAISERRLTLDRTPDRAGELLIAAAPGEVAGPWSESGGWRVMLVGRKSPPSLAVPELRERAREELLRDALDRTLAGRTGWPTPL